jgi:hypothetical protein
VSRRPVPVWSGVVGPDGKLHLDSRGLFDGYLKRLANQPVQLVVRKQARAKSRSQLGYWHGVLIPVLAEEFGYMEWEHDAVHDAVMRQLRGLKPDPNPLGLRVSMAEMSHEDVSQLIEDARHWAVVEHGIVIPDPEQAECAA